MHGGFLVPLFSALVVGLCGQTSSPQHSPGSRLSCWGSSYALFLLHFNFINMLRTYHVPERLHLAAYDPWISYAAALGLAVVAMYFVERPARRAILQRKPAAA